MDNIFSALCKYKPQPTVIPIENFFTESFKFLLSQDDELCHSFVKYIAPGKKFIGPYNIESQKKYGNSTIDLLVVDKNNQKILIEIKIGAKENRYFDEDSDIAYGQIDKYLRLNKGYVCFIAREENNVLVNNGKENYLGQFEWFEIYKLFSDYVKRSNVDKINKYLINNFLNFMEDNEMHPFAGFDKQDVKLANSDLFSFINKLIDYLRFATKDRGIRDLIKRNGIMGSPKYYEKHAQVMLSLTKKRWGECSVEIGFVYFDNDFKKGLFFYQGIYMPDKYFELFADIKVDKKYFEKTKEDGWFLDKEFQFIDFFKKGEKPTIDYIFKSLTELEKSGIFKILDKINDK